MGTAEHATIWARLFDVVHWQQLRGLGNSRAVRNSYLWLVFVPIAAHLASKLPDELHVAFAGHDLRLPLGLPFSWKVFYAGAVCFSLASFLFQWKCPKIIKEFGNFKEFETAGGSSKLLTDYFYDAVNAFAAHNDAKEVAESFFRQWGQFRCEFSPTGPKTPHSVWAAIAQFRGHQILESSLPDAFVEVQQLARYRQPIGRWSFCKPIQPFLELLSTFATSRAFVCHPAGEDEV
jgi:hypothetical protein